jgi:hypothetical protein
MARPRAADGGEGLQIWRVAENTLNKQSRAGTRGGLPAWGLGGGPKIPHSKRSLLRNGTQRFGLQRLGWEVVDWIHLAPDRDQWRAVMNTVMNLSVP